MHRPSLLLASVLSLAPAACSSSDSPPATTPAADSGNPSQDAQPSEAATPQDAAQEPSDEAQADTATEPDAEAGAQQETSAEAAAGSKQTGELCSESWECANSANCVSGQYTPAHCNPNCVTDADCAASAPNAKGTCQDGGSIKFCMFLCGAFGGGATCPGDLKCDGAVCG